jgi:hypothetical protein
MKSGVCGQWRTTSVHFPITPCFVHDDCRAVLLLLIAMLGSYLPPHRGARRSVGVAALSEPYRTAISSTRSANTLRSP